MDSAALLGAWGDAIVRGSVEGGAALAAAWLVCRLAPRLHPSLQSWLWRFAYLKLALALLPATVPLPLLPASEAVATLAGAAALSATAPAAAPFPTAPALAFGLWAIGCLIGLARTVGEARAARRLVRGCLPVDDPELEAESAALAAGMRRPPRLACHPEVAAPFLIGFRRPVIVLPESFGADFDAPQRRMVLAHELAHARRGDLAWAWLPRLLRCVFFFHPLVWLADREWRQAQEMACDREVLRLEAVSPSAYGAVLLQAAEAPRQQMLSGLAAVRVAESYSTVRRRLMAMKHTVGGSARALPFVLVCGALALVPWRVVAQDAPHTVKVVHGVPLDPEVTAIHANALKKVMEVLTPAQRKQLHESAMAHGVRMTPEQKTQLESYKKRAEVEFRKIDADASLTPEQKEERKTAAKRRLETEIAGIFAASAKVVVGSPAKGDAVHTAQGAPAAHAAQLLSGLRDLTDEQQRRIEVITRDSHRQLEALQAKRAKP